MLFDPERHESLSEEKWSEERVIQAIHEIFNNSIENLDQKKYWPVHENEDGENRCKKTLYNGAAGNIWALSKIADFLKCDLPFDKSALIKQVYGDYLKSPDTEEIVPSYYLGQVGILIIQYSFSPSEDVADEIFRLVSENIENKTLEALWGAPGTMVAASFMYQWSKEKKWSDLYNENVEFLVKKLKETNDKGEKIWFQDMYSMVIQYVGAGHGYFGNIFGMLHQKEQLSKNNYDYIVNHVSQTLIDLAMRKDDQVNWPPLIADPKGRLPLVQWCHGAPGIITAMNVFPKDYNKDVENHLIAGGELVWKAGPLKKGVGLCHGTDGNGIAFLQLYNRTADIKWLDRARAFAMHSLKQRNDRYSLFTGELGLAIYLINCIEGQGGFPTLDYL